MPTLQKSSQTSSRNSSSTFLLWFSVILAPGRPQECSLICFHSNPACSDIMEIYNAVEEMDGDEEVRLDPSPRLVLDLIAS